MFQILELLGQIRNLWPKIAQIKPPNDNFFYQFWRENSNISNFLPLKIVNFGTK